MSDTKAERLAGALNGFISSSPDVEAAAVVSFDGLAMASAIPADMDEDRLGAMSAALLSLGEQAASGLGRGELHQVFVEADEGFVFLMSARDEAVLAAVTGRRAKIGLMLYEMRHAADTIGTVLANRAEGEPVDDDEVVSALEWPPATDDAAADDADHHDDGYQGADGEPTYAVVPVPAPADAPNGASPGAAADHWS